MNRQAKTYLKRLAVKGVKTSAQTLGAMLAASGAGLVDADWIGSLSTAGMAGLIAVLMNIGGDAGEVEPSE